MKESKLDKYIGFQTLASFGYDPDLMLKLVSKHIKTIIDNNKKVTKLARLKLEMLRKKCKKEVNKIEIEINKLEQKEKDKI